MRFLLLFAFLLSFQAYSQDKKSRSFSLQEAIDFALDSNYSAINARRDVAAALKQRWETTATGLPQISGAVDYTNRLKQPVTLIPAEFTGGDPGTFTPVVFGVPQNMRASATLNQLLFDGTYIVALEASKTFLEYSKNLEKKTESVLREQVISAYGNVLLSQENISILDKNLETVSENLRETREIYKNGLTEEEDVEQLQITLSNLQIQLENAKRVLQLSKELFNITLGIDIKVPVVFTDSLESLIREQMEMEILAEELDLEKNIDYRIAFNFTEQRRLELKQQRYTYLPTLSSFLNYGTEANSDSFTFLDSDQRWFQSSILGVSLKMPIFSSFGRRARIQRAEIAYDQAKTEFEKAKQEIRLEERSAKNSYRFAVEKYENSKANLSLAERIENKNRIKFFEGLSGSFELRQAQLQLYGAQQEFLQAMVEVITSKAELERILNN